MVIFPSSGSIIRPSHLSTLSHSYGLRVKMRIRLRDRVRVGKVRAKCRVGVREKRASERVREGG